MQTTSIVAFLLACANVACEEATANPSASIGAVRALFKRQIDNSSGEFTWKASKIPSFVTSTLRKQDNEPVVKIYPPNEIYRSGRSRDYASKSISAQQRSLTTVPAAPLKRVVYYATLPEVAHYPAVVVDDDTANRRFGDYQSAIAAVPALPYSPQRSYNPANVGKDFVTRVQSSVIGIRPSGGDNKKDTVKNTPPTFTIIDAPYTTSYADGLDRIMIPELQQNYDRNTLSHVYGHMAAPLYPYKRYYHHANAIPYHGPYSGVDKSHYHLPHRYPVGHLTPYEYNDVEKFPPAVHHRNQYLGYAPAAYFNAPPYPTRHNRFPPDRYTTGSPLSILDSTAPPRPSQPPPDMPYQANPLGNSGVDFVPPSSTSSLLPNSGLDLNVNLRPSLDHSLGSLDSLDDRRFGLSFRNKFNDYAGSNFAFNAPWSNKYVPSADFESGFNSDFFKPQFSQVSDWLTGKPSFDETSNIDLDDFNAAAAAAANAATAGEHNYHVKGQLAPYADTIGSQNGTESESTTNNTVITPFTSSFNETSIEERTRVRK